MTNNEIISEVQDELIKAGIISEEEEIHTFAFYKQFGYNIVKGSKAVAKFPIWKPVTKKSETDEEKLTTKMIMVKAAFFSTSQVVKA